jgi:putative isomerase
LVPNFATVNGVSSRDRSEPPVGALICRELYRKFGERWFLEEVFPNLLRWNRWWHEHRCMNGLLCWGSDPYEPVLGSGLELAINHRQGAAWESGLDNLPVYDDVPFDPRTHLMLLHDAGLNGLYLADCDALADIAVALGEKETEQELHHRADLYRQALTRLWDEQRGIFGNRRADTGEFSPRIAPTSFYPLLAKAATQAQVERMMNEHFYNPLEFWGEWIIPATPRNDPSFHDQDYWRGRIWGPMNFLVYLGLRNYDVPQARKDMAEKSVSLLLKEWLEKGHVHENFNGSTGEGCDKANSDAFYHWGGLLGMIGLIEAGYMPAPEVSLI